MTIASSSPLRDRIRAVEQAASALSLLEATRSLASDLADTSGAGNPQAPSAPLQEGIESDEQTAAIACLVQVLGFNNPGAAVAAVDGLISLGSAAVPPLLERLDPRNYGARAWAVRALAGIGDVRGLSLLEEALATDVGPSVRRAAACGLGQLQLQPLAAAEQAVVRARAMQALLDGCRDGEWVVRYAVAVGLESLLQGMEPLEVERQQALAALEQLSSPDLEDTPVVRLRASLAVQRLQASRHPSVTP
ncbi:MAG: HEAT repeat domain-containing protein [Cyanobium sp.]